MIDHVLKIHSYLFSLWPFWTDTVTLFLRLAAQYHKNIGIWGTLREHLHTLEICTVDQILRDFLRTYH